MEPNDEEFEKLLKGFKDDYEIRSTFIEKHLNKFIKLLPADLKAAGVRFQDPITGRIKTLESALGSLGRRRDERMKRLGLKKRMVAKGRSWEEYWNYRKKPDMINDVGEFPDNDSMFEALHDIGGIRILVYFPGHVGEVVEALKRLEGIEVIRIVQRGQKFAPDMYELERSVNELEGKLVQDDLIDDKIFSGYRATHVHLRLYKGQALIEIQIATVVMNAWSEVEHKIIYKPPKAPSKEEMRILDTFNGIVMIGENALIQLEEMIAREEKARLTNSKTFATGIYDVGKWIEDHCADRNRLSVRGRSQTWKYLQKLLDVLEAKGEHTSGQLKQLIDNLSEKDFDEAVLSRELPLHLMKQRCQVHENEIADVPNIGLVRIMSLIDERRNALPSVLFKL